VAGVRGHGAAGIHVVMHHSQYFAIGWVAKHGMGFAGSTSILNLMFSEAVHSAAHCLNKCNICIIHHWDDILGRILQESLQLQEAGDQ
jgi:hypothetical protein